MKDYDKNDNAAALIFALIMDVISSLSFWFD